MKQQVNHPKHYNRHPRGIECIEIVELCEFGPGGEGSPRAGRAIFLLYSPTFWSTTGERQYILNRFVDMFGGDFGSILFTPDHAKSIYPFR